MLASALPSVSRLDRRSKESHGVVEVILPRVVAEDGENDERHSSPFLVFIEKEYVMII